MKKLLIALMSMASFAVFAEETPSYISGTSFEGLTVGNPLDVTADDGSGTDGKAYWLIDNKKPVSGEGTTDCIVTNRVDLGSYSGESPAIAGSPNEKALYVDTDKVLNRTINGQEGDAENIGSGLYVDTLVQFTAADAAEEPADGDKLVVWMQAVDADEANGIPASTNLVVTAAQLGNGNVPTRHDYVITNVVVQPNTWHRLTIKAIEQLGSGSSAVGVAGFVVFVDETELAAPDARTTSDGTVFDNLSATASAWNDKKALFPSLVTYESDACGTITSLGLKGVGAVDDITFTRKAPSFAADASLFNLKWNPAAFTSLMVNEDPVEGGSVDLPISGETTFEISYVLASGFAMSAPTCDSGVTANLDAANKTVTVTLSATGSVTLNASQVYYGVGGNEYADFASAYAAAKGTSFEDCGTIKLLADVTLDDTSSELAPGAIVIDEEDAVVIDLAGKTLTGTSEAVGTIANLGGLLMITNSTTEVGEVRASEVGLSVSATAGTTTITAGKYTGSVGYDKAEMIVITGGIFYDELEAETAGDFYLVTGGIVEATAVTYLGGYLFQVGEAVAVETFDVYVAPAAEHSSVSVKLNGETDIVGVANVYSANVGDTIAVKYTADTGWHFVEGATTTAEFDSADTTTFAEAPAVEQDVVVTYAVTFSTNDVNVAEAEIEVEDGAILADKDIPTFEGGTWDVDPNGAVITCNTNFNYTVAAPQPKTWKVSFYTNAVDVANLVETKEIVDNTALAEADIPEIFGTLEGTWKTNPTGAVITAAAEFVFTIAEPSPSTHDIASGDYYIDCDGEVGAKTLKFSSIQVTADGWKVGLGAKAIKVPTAGAEFTLVCKTELTSTKTVELPAVLTTGTEEEAAAGIFTIAPASTKDYDQLFILGVGPAAQPE